MPTLCIRYRLDPLKLDVFEAYAKALRPIVERCGGMFVGYYLPTKLAGPTDAALGLIDFPTLEAYETYRIRLAEDAEAVEVTRKAAVAIRGEDRSFLSRAEGENRPYPTDASVVQNTASASGLTPVEHIYFAWEAALSANDPEALLALYAEDAHLESPLVPHLLETNTGVLRGREELRRLFDVLAVRKPPIRQYFRTSYLTDGKRLIWEYPREGAQGDQMDFVEAMELNSDGLIQRHRVYWGWLGFGVLQRDEYHR
jgi:NIPSNAP/SnoaL-like domain